MSNHFFYPTPMSLQISQCDVIYVIYEQPPPPLRQIQTLVLTIIVTLILVFIRRWHNVKNRFLFRRLEIIIAQILIVN